MSEMVQGSAEWIAARVGKVTASRIADVMAKTRTGYGASRANYLAELVAERLTGQPAEQFTSAAMQWGTEHEAEARTAYEFYSDVDVVQVGFVDHPRIPFSGASPDGLVGTDGLVEIKCPSTSTHIETLLVRSVPSKYIGQMHFQMMCCERSFCDFVSFDPRMPEAMRLFVQRVDFDPKLAKEIETEVVAFLSELDRKVMDLQTLYSLGKAA